MTTHLDDLLQIRVSDLIKAGGLTPRQTYDLKWANGSEAGVSTGEDVLRMSYSFKGEDRLSLIVLSYSACNYGGQRPWLVCPMPRCAERAGVLFIYYGNVMCRKCTGLYYASQCATANWRMTERMWKLRVKHGIKRGDLRPPSTIPKPKGKHYRTHKREIDYLEHIEHKAWGRQWLMVQALKRRCG